MGTVDDYLAERDEPVRSQVAQAYQTAEDAAQQAGAEIAQGESYGMAALLYRGKGLISVQQTVKHIGVYPYSATVVSKMIEKFGAGDHAKGSMRFPYSTGVPDEIVRSLVACRIAEIDKQLDK